MCATILPSVFLKYFDNLFITSWEIDGETVETMSDFILGAPDLYLTWAPGDSEVASTSPGPLSGNNHCGEVGWD